MNFDKHFDISKGFKCVEHYAAELKDKDMYVLLNLIPERPEDCREKLIRLAEKGYETLRESIHRQYEGGKEKWKKKTKSDCKKQ